MTRSKDKESIYYENEQKKQFSQYNPQTHRFLLKKKRQARRQKNIALYGAERRPLTKEELEEKKKQMELEEKRLQDRKKKKQLEQQGEDEVDSDQEFDDILNEDGNTMTDLDVKIADERDKLLNRDEDDDCLQENTIIIQNISRRSSSKRIRKAFREFGNIRHLYFPISSSRKPKGFAIIEFEDHIAAQKALKFDGATHIDLVVSVGVYSLVEGYLLNSDNHKQAISLGDLLRLEKYLKWKDDQRTPLEALIYQKLKQDREEKEKKMQAKRELKLERQLKKGKKRKFHETRTYEAFEKKKKKKRRK